MSYSLVRGLIITPIIILHFYPIWVVWYFGIDSIVEFIFERKVDMILNGSIIAIEGYFAFKNHQMRTQLMIVVLIIDLIILLIGLGVFGLMCFLADGWLLVFGGRLYKRTN